MTENDHFGRYMIILRLNKTISSDIDRLIDQKDHFDDIDHLMDENERFH
jgi:hypothetical protein